MHAKLAHDLMKDTKAAHTTWADRRDPTESEFNEGGCCTSFVEYTKSFVRARPYSSIFITILTFGLITMTAGLIVRNSSVSINANLDDRIFANAHSFKFPDEPSQFTMNLGNSFCEPTKVYVNAVSPNIRISSIRGRDTSFIQTNQYTRLELEIQPLPRNPFKFDFNGYNLQMLWPAPATVSILDESRSGQEGLREHSFPYQEIKLVSGKDICFELRK